jgi:hypothetical protein
MRKRHYRLPLLSHPYNFIELRCRPKRRVSWRANRAPQMVIAMMIKLIIPASSFKFTPGLAYSKANMDRV